MRCVEMVEVTSAREVVAKQTYDARATKKFTFDRAFGQESRQVTNKNFHWIFFYLILSPQNSVYETVVSPLISEVLDGYNCTVFAYGQVKVSKFLINIHKIIFPPHRPELAKHIQWLVRRHP